MRFIFSNHSFQFIHVKIHEHISFHFISIHVTDKNTVKTNVSAQKNAKTIPQTASQVTKTASRQDTSKKKRDSKLKIEDQQLTKTQGL